MQHSQTLHNIIPAKFGISNATQSPGIAQYSHNGISTFLISGQSFIIKNCHNSRTMHDIDMKLGPESKFDGSQILDEWSIKLIFPLTITFYLTKTDNKTKKSLTQL